jgi:hypothetical protein
MEVLAVFGQAPFPTLRRHHKRAQNMIFWCQSCGEQHTQPHVTSANITTCAKCGGSSFATWKPSPLHSLSQEAVRDEALDLGQFVNAASIGGSDSPHQVVEKLQRAINAAALKREPDAQAWPEFDGTVHRVAVKIGEDNWRILSTSGPTTAAPVAEMVRKFNAMCDTFAADNKLRRDLRQADTILAKLGQPDLHPPESETPETDRLVAWWEQEDRRGPYYELALHARSLERRLSEVKELNAVNESGCDNALRRLETCSKVCAELTPALAQAQSRIAELEKDAARLAFIEQTLSDNAGDGLEVYPLGAEMDDAYEKITRWICFHHDNEGATFREALDAAILKSRA